MRSGPVQEAEPFPRRRVHHHDLALYRRESKFRVLGMDRDELGDGDLPVRGRHDQQYAFLLERNDEPGWGLQTAGTPGERDLADRGGQVRIGQAVCGLCCVQDLQG